MRIREPQTDLFLSLCFQASLEPRGPRLVRKGVSQKSAAPSSSSKYKKHSEGDVQRDGGVKRRGPRRLSLSRAPRTLPLTLFTLWLPTVQVHTE